MKDLQHILDTIQQLEAADESYVLATIVQISGSAYRGPGTRMLITRDQHTIGTISGGCLERAVLDTAIQVFENGVPLILTTLGFTFMGEALRDILDPRLRRGL